MNQKLMKWKKTIVKTGIEVLKESNFKILKNKKILLLTNHIGVDNTINAILHIKIYNKFYYYEVGKALNEISIINDNVVYK